ncbi:MAG TPA: hypothetical protein VKS43_01160 [Burkholderiales bacterium]|nr:hypothetical protein [Burkholderiales bacterium]
MALAALLLAGGEALAADEAKEATASFYRAYAQLRKTEGMTGIPNEAQLAKLSPLITPALRGLFSAALREQKRCKDRFPGDKPPWIEGDIFSSNFEGFTSFSVADSRPRNQGRQVSVSFTYAEGKSRVRWNDVLVLRNGAGRWLVEDLYYHAHFAFGSGFGSNLKSSLKRIPAC